MRLPESFEENTTVFQKNGELYCETDYKKNFVPRCAFCSGFIMKVNMNLKYIKHFTWIMSPCSDNNKSLHFFCFKKDCIKALNQTWHPDHFTCAKCGEAFGPNQVMPMCAIYFECFLLNTSYLCDIWIPYTFANISLNIYFKGFHEMESPKNGKPYCRNCYIDLTCSKCTGCKQAITDKAVKALNSDWHVECFICKVGVV